MSSSAPPGWPLGAHDPSTLGTYTLLRRLGEGGMGTVYLGRSRAGRLVAVKVIRPEFAQVDEFRVRFVRETAHAQRVARFCTAEVLDVDADGERPYLVTEFVEGETLAQVVAETGPLTAANLERLAVGVAAALTAIHGAGIVHRDLKPGNVMLSPFGPRVIDFGIARASDAALGMTQIRVGTPAFMAPEQVMGDALTPALDVFAWGATVAYAGTGRLPFGDDAEQLFRRILTAPPDLEGLRGNAFLLPIVERAMSKDPAARPASNELLLGLLGGAGAGPSALGDPEAAVTQALVGWSPPLDEAATVLPGSATFPSAPAAAAASAAPDVPVPTAPATPPPHQPATAATVLPGRQIVPTPPTGRTGPGGVRVVASPPVRPGDPPPPAAGPGGPGGRPRRRRRAAAFALVAAVVVAALVVGGVLLLGGDPGTTPSGARSPGSSGSAGPAPLPRSAALPVDTMVVDRTDGTSHLLFTLAADGSGATQLGDAGSKELPGLSPDRRTVAYYVRSSGALGLMAADGSGARPLLVGASTALTPCSSDRTAWNPTGTQVAICATGPAGAGLYVVDPVAGSFRKLPTQSRVGDPAWSPRGDRILYWSSPSGNGGPLYTVAADGSGRPQPLTDGVDAEPVWAPDAAHVTFRRTTATGFDIYSMRSDGDPKTLEDFTGGAGANTSPSYSPDLAGGGRIVFVSDRTGTPSLYVTHPNTLGADAAPVPGQTAGVVHPSWSSGPPLS